MHLYEELSCTSSKDMLGCLDKEIKPSVISYAWWWIVEKMDLYNPYSGITDNLAGSMNKLIVDRDWTKRPVDCIML